MHHSEIKNNKNIFFLSIIKISKASTEFFVTVLTRSVTAYSHLRDFGLSFRLQGDMNICRHVTRVPLDTARARGWSGVGRAPTRRYFGVRCPKLSVIASIMGEHDHKCRSRTESARLRFNYTSRTPTILLWHRTSRASPDVFSTLKIKPRET